MPTVKRAKKRVIEVKKRSMYITRKLLFSRWPSGLRGFHISLVLSNTVFRHEPKVSLIPSTPKALMALLSALALPVKISKRMQYEVEAQHNMNSFTPHLVGFMGMYCRTLLY